MLGCWARWEENIQVPRPQEVRASVRQCLGAGRARRARGGHFKFCQRRKPQGSPPDQHRLFLGVPLARCQRRRARPSSTQPTDSNTIADAEARTRLCREEREIGGERKKKREEKEREERKKERIDGLTTSHGQVVRIRASLCNSAITASTTTPKFSVCTHRSSPQLAAVHRSRSKPFSGVPNGIRAYFAQRLHTLLPQPLVQPTSLCVAVAASRRDRYTRSRIRTLRLSCCCCCSPGLAALADQPTDHRIVSTVSSNSVVCCVLPLVRLAASLFHILAVSLAFST